jgi:mycothiol synthase
MHDHQDVIAERDGVVARVLAGADGVGDAIALLDAAEAHLEVPLVDEAERERLHDLADGLTTRAAHWHSLLARRGGVAVGYAGVLLPSGPGLVATGDIAVAREHGTCTPVLSALLAGLEGLAWQHLAGRLMVWIRHARPADVVCATDEGFSVERRLGVLGRHLDAAVEVDRHLATDSDAPTVRAYRPDRDDDAVVAVLAAAYAGTADGGWDLPRFRERRGWSWFDPEDLLVAEDPDGRIVGLHWLKRRDATTGEVYNLAVHPDAQGRQVGAVLLDAGLAHLRDAGCTEVLLWVDLANERAVRLYTSAGFATRWEDVALVRTLRGRVSGGGEA